MIPYRPCCGQQHLGVQCPDGLVMCCLCFSRFPVDQLNVTEDGKPENVCQPCAYEEYVEITERASEA